MKVLERLMGRRSESSGKVAKERLRVVLAHDRSNISPAVLETLKDEIISVSARPVAIDAESVQVTFSQSARESRLVADIPLSARRKRHKR